MEPHSKPTIGLVEFIGSVIECNEKGEPFCLAPNAETAVTALCDAEALKLVRGG